MELLSNREGDVIKIGHDIEIIVTRIDGQVEMVINAPEKVLEKIRHENNISDKDKVENFN